MNVFDNVWLFKAFQDKNRLIPLKIKHIALVTQCYGEANSDVQLKNVSGQTLIIFLNVNQTDKFRKNEDDRERRFFS